MTVCRHELEGFNPPDNSNPDVYTNIIAEVTLPATSPTW